MSLPDDTKPRSPFEEPLEIDNANLIPPPDEDYDGPAGGPGCGIWTIIGVMIAGFAVVIVLLAGVAGWTSGTRIAEESATATQSAEIQDQIWRISDDVAQGNTVLLQARINYLLAITPAIPEMPQIFETATAVYINKLPTHTPEPTETPIPTETPVPTEVTVVEIESTGGTYNMPALLEEARAMVARGAMLDAIDMLDAIIAIDPNFETVAVRTLMLDALSSRALSLFRGGQTTGLAEAVLLTERAREFGLSGTSELHFEQEVASLYLRAQSSIGTNYPAAIEALRQLYSIAPNYMDTRDMLFNQYVAYGDAWLAQGEACPAVGQYQNALSLLSSGSVVAKRDTAQTVCDNATPVGGPPPALDENGQEVAPIAPIGVGQ